MPRLLHRHPHRRRYLTVFATAVLTLVTTASTAAADPPPVRQLPPAPADEFLDLDAKPTLTWSVPGRYSASWDAYTPSTGYDHDFVNPSTWSMNLNGCSSTSKWRITSYTFSVTNIATNWTQNHTTTACNLTLHTLPTQGLYRLSLVLHTSTGSLSGVSLATTRIGEIRDYLIVSMGDSLASGEGNPDVPGDYSVSLSPSQDPISVTVKRAAQWKDRRCHRSAKSGPALAAKAIEDASPYTSVTFVSVACSGAEVRHLIGDSYAGIEPTGGPLLSPQIDTVRSLVGPDSPRGGRGIDALLISAGINNLGFSDMIRRCALNNNLDNRHEECVIAGGVQTQLAELRRQYAYLALTLQVGLPRTREIYLSDYPANVFLGGACGLLGLPGVGIDAAEGQEMEVQGTALNWKITEATDAFREYHWNRTAWLTTSFNGHGYCAGAASWFTRLEQSFATQGDRNGTAHPNAAGHLAYADLLRQAIVPDQASQPDRSLTITIEAVKVANVPGGLPFAVNPVLWQYQNDPYGKTLPLDIPRNGLWTPVAAPAGTFTLDVFRPPASPRHAIELYISLAHILPIHHTFSDDFGVGTHEATNPTGSLAVRYRISAQFPGPTGNG